MHKTFKLDIMTPEVAVFKGEVYSLIAPAALGYLGILAEHAPIVTNLNAGKIIIKENSGQETVIHNKGKGFLEARNNKAVMLLDSIE